MAASKFKKRNIPLCRKSIEELPTATLEQAREFLLSLQDYKKVCKLKETYVDGVRRALDNTKNGRIYYEINFDGTVTGRLSCSKMLDLGVSFHTLARDNPYANIRELFIAPPGHAFITADYSGMEMRIAAHLSQDPMMIRALVDGIDFHTFSAQMVFDKEEVTKEERQIAKSVSFLVLYGGGAYNLAQTHNLPMRKATMIIERYKELYERLFEYIEECHDFILKNHYVDSLFGRRRHLGNVASRDKRVVQRCLRQGFNFEVQSLASDITEFSVLDSGIEFDLQEMESMPVCTVHDSGEYITPFHEIEKALEIVYDKMTNYPLIRAVYGIEFDVPLGVDIEIGHSFGGGLDVHFMNGKVMNLGEIDEYFRAA